MEQCNFKNKALTQAKKKIKKSNQLNRRCPYYDICSGKGNIDKNRCRHFIAKNCPKNIPISRLLR